MSDDTVPTMRELLETMVQLSETPCVQDTELDFGLKTQDSNRKRLQDLMNRNPKIVFTDKQFTLYHEGDQFHGHIFMVNYDIRQIVYLIEYEGIEMTVFGHTVTEVQLWRSLTYNYPLITKKVFYEYLIENFDCVMSDKTLTMEGKKYWITRMSDTLLSPGKYTVGMLNWHNEIVKYDPNTGRLDDWIEKQDGFGETQKHMDCRFFIYKN